jgi:hypothetical protein
MNKGLKNLPIFLNKPPKGFPYLFFCRRLSVIRLPPLAEKGHPGACGIPDSPNKGGKSTL